MQIIVLQYWHFSYLSSRFEVGNCSSAHRQAQKVAIPNSSSLFSVVRAIEGKTPPSFHGSWSSPLDLGYLWRTELVSTLQNLARQTIFVWADFFSRGCCSPSLQNCLTVNHSPYCSDLWSCCPILSLKIDLESLMRIISGLILILGSFFLVSRLLGLASVTILYYILFYIHENK